MTCSARRWRAPTPQVIQHALRERNDIERKTEVEIKQRDISTAKLSLDLEQDLALAAATQDREVRTRQALEKSSAEQKSIEEGAEGRTGAHRQRARGQAVRDRARPAASHPERAQAAGGQAAEITRNQAIEVAEQQADRGDSRAARSARPPRRSACWFGPTRAGRAGCQDGRGHAEAQREAQIQVIEAERDAQRAMIDHKNTVEIEALRKQREAEAQATALKEISAAEAEAAQKQAETKRTQAAAESEAEQAARRRHEGEDLRGRSGRGRCHEGQGRSRDARSRSGPGQRSGRSRSAKGQGRSAGRLRRGGAAGGDHSSCSSMRRCASRSPEAQALGNALSSMNIKLIGDPTAASPLLRMVTLADGVGEVVKPRRSRCARSASRLVNKATGNDGDSLMKLGDGDGKIDATNGIAELALLVPEIIKITEKTLDVNALKGQTVGQVLATLARRTTGEDASKVAKAQKALAMLPIVNDLPFDDVYLRATAK